MVVGENGTDVKEIAEASKGQSQAQANFIGDATRKEAHTSESGIESDSRIVDIFRLQLSTSTESIDRIVHSRTQKADEGDQDNLHPGSREPWKGPWAYLKGFVHPWRAALWR